MKRILILAVLLLSGALAFAQKTKPEKCFNVAHRGCWLKAGDEFYINENCPAGVWMAAQYGYPAIECDVKYTRDSATEPSTELCATLRIILLSVNL